MAGGDIDGDGFLDVIVGNSNSSSVTVLWGSDEGPRPQEAIALAGSTVETGDVNGDSIVDVITSGAYDVYTIINAHSGLTTPVASSTPAVGGIGAFASADLNGDRLADCVVGKPQSQTVSVGIGDGAGSFNFIQTFANERPTAIACVDVDMDGDRDIVVVGTTITAYLNSGNGRVSSGITTCAICGTAVAAAEFR